MTLSLAFFGFDTDLWPLGFRMGEGGSMGSSSGSG